MVTQMYSTTNLKTILFPSKMNRTTVLVLCVNRAITTW